MKLSVIIATRNRAHAIAESLDSIAASLANAAPIDAEIVVIDNGSRDATSKAVEQWAVGCPFPVRLVVEPRPGLSVARNRALRTAQGELLVFTDDDCRLSKQYISELLRYDASDIEPVLRGGSVELGDQTDLPITIRTTKTRQRFNRHTDPATHDSIVGHISGCNMAMRRGLVEKLGPFDERFGAGSKLESGEDSDYLFRAYLAGFTLEYVPDMTVFHYHGRKQKPVGYKLYRGYSIGTGAIYAKYLFRQPKLCVPFCWDLKKSISEIVSGKNLFYPIIGFSFKHKVAYAALGAIKFCLISQCLQPWPAQDSAQSDNATS
ncbi:MAG TPA: glycosyltransferase family 2 protein [Chthoniobacterales bacterium]